MSQTETKEDQDSLRGLSIAGIVAGSILLMTTIVLIIRERTYLGRSKLLMLYTMGAVLAMAMIVMSSHWIAKNEPLF